MYKYNLNQSYDTIVAIMANCPGHSVENINNGIALLKQKKLREVRSFNNLGEESGLLILSKEIMINNFDISYYIGNIQSNVKEIHLKEYESWLTVSNVTSTTFTVQVLPNTPSTNTNVHHFQSAEANGLYLAGNDPTSDGVWSKNLTVIDSNYDNIYYCYNRCNLYNSYNRSYNDYSYYRYNY